MSTVGGLLVGVGTKIGSISTYRERIRGWGGIVFIGIGRPQQTVSSPVVADSAHFYTQH